MKLEEALKKLKSENCPSGLKLDLLWNYFGNKGAQALAEALETGNCPAGLHLYLNGNNISDEGAQALAEVIKINNTLTTLILGYNDSRSASSPLKNSKSIFKKHH